MSAHPTQCNRPKEDGSRYPLEFWRYPCLAEHIKAKYPEGTEVVRTEGLFYCKSKLSGTDITCDMGMKSGAGISEHQKSPVHQQSHNNNQYINQQLGYAGQQLGCINHQLQVVYSGQQDYNHNEHDNSGEQGG